MAESRHCPRCQENPRWSTPATYLEFILTDNCNLRCTYCWQKNKKPHDMEEATALAGMDFLMKASGGVRDLTVLLFGGEPMLRFDLIERLWAYGSERAAERSKAIHWTMTTNGTLVSEDRARWLARHKVIYLLSIDGGPEDHDRHRKYPDGSGSFRSIAEKLPYLKRYQPWQGVKMSLTPESVDGLLKSVEMLHGLGINQFILGHAHGLPWTDEDLDAYERSLLAVCELYLEKKRRKEPFRITLFEEGEPGKARRHDHWGCGAGRGRLCVDSYGDLYGCSKLATIRGTRQGVLPLGTVFQGLTQRENRLKLIDPTDGPRPKCAACDLKAACSGGCPAINIAETGDVYCSSETECRFVAITERIHQHVADRFPEVFPEFPITGQPASSSVA